MKAAACLKAKVAVDASEENLIAAIHLMNRHSVAQQTALDHSSHSGFDRGIDAWHYNETNKALYIYQSKLAESKQYVLKGLQDLKGALAWLHQVIADGKVDHVPTENHCLYNLYLLLAQVRGELKSVHVALLYPLRQSSLDDEKEVMEFKETLSHLPLQAFLAKQLEAKLTFCTAHYDLEPGILPRSEPDIIPVLPETRLHLRPGTHLDLAYVPLHSLVKLYRHHGDLLFDKNVRLSLASMAKPKAKDKDKLVNPMRETLDQITSKRVHPNLFPFYHVGVTIAAPRSPENTPENLSLEEPSIINGCQTITIANAYLAELEKANNTEAIDRFKQINVVTKVVIGVSDDEIKEITNANNRQNPIENWQLFSNELIHIEIEDLLKAVGIFYERQKGKFETMKNCDTARQFTNTNNTYIKMLDLAQVMALSKGKLDFAAKPSDVFARKTNHEEIFGSSIRYAAGDLVYSSNVFKAAKRALTNYLNKPAHANSNAALIFAKTNVRMHTFRLAMLHFYKHRNEFEEYSRKLNRIASPFLVDEAEKFYPKIILQIKSWYTNVSKDLEIEVSKTKLQSYFDTLSTQLGLDEAEEQMPFAA